MQKPKVLGNIMGHITAEQRQGREESEARFRRDEVLLSLPAYMNDDADAIAVWVQTCEDAEAFGIFDNLDRDTLGSYCMITSRILALRRVYKQAIEDGDDDMLGLARELRQQETLQLSYANKLGLTPESRARLALRMAGPPEKDAADALYGDA